MPNHWHFVPQPTDNGGMSNFLRWVSLPNTMRLHGHDGTGGRGRDVGCAESVAGRTRAEAASALRSAHRPLTALGRAGQQAAELKAVRTSVNRGSTFGDGHGVQAISRHLNLQSTVRPRGRPKRVLPPFPPVGRRRIHVQRFSAPSAAKQ